MNEQLPIPNPYDVLEVSPAASNKEITLAFTMAIKRRKHSPNEIAIARKSLMNPQERIIADYLRPIIATIKHFKPSDFSILDTPTPQLEFLTKFDDLEGEILASRGVSSSDKRLGQILFSDSSVQK